MSDMVLFKDKYMIREQNTRLVLEQIILNKQISRASIAITTGLNKATISEIAKTLILDQLVIELGPGEGSSAGGRKPIMLEFNHLAGVCVSVDVGHKSIKGMLTYLNGDIIQTYKKKIPINKENIMEEINQVSLYFETYLPKTHYGTVGMTVAIHGIVDCNKIIFTPYYDLDKIDLHALLSKEYPFPIHLENEANLTAVAESTFSSAKIQNLMSVSIYKGIGAGIIINSDLYHGYKGQAGEIGHTILYPGGRDCPCGNKGCLEQYCSTEVLVEQYKNSKQIKEITTTEFVQAYHDGDPVALQIIMEFCKNISIGLNDIISAYSPEVIYMNGTIFSLEQEILSIINGNLKSTFSHNTRIEISPLGEMACLLGGIATSLLYFLNVENLSLTKQNEEEVG